MACVSPEPPSAFETWFGSNVDATVSLPIYGLGDLEDLVAVAGAKRENTDIPTHALAIHRWIVCNLEGFLRSKSGEFLHVVRGHDSPGEALSYVASQVQRWVQKPYTRHSELSENMGTDQLVKVCNCGPEVALLKEIIRFMKDGRRIKEVCLNRAFRQSYAQFAMKSGENDAGLRFRALLILSDGFAVDGYTGVEIETATEDAKIVCALLGWSDERDMPADDQTPNDERWLRLGKIYGRACRSVANSPQLEAEGKRVPRGGKSSLPFPFLVVARCCFARGLGPKFWPEVDKPTWHACQRFEDGQPHLTACVEYANKIEELATGEKKLTHEQYYLRALAESSRKMTEPRRKMTETKSVGAGLSACVVL